MDHIFWKLFTLLMFGLIFQSSFAIRNRYTERTWKICIDRTIKSLEDVTDFYQNNVQNVNLDSIYGLRVAQGSLSNILKKLSIDHCFYKRLHSLYNNMKNAADKSLPYLKEYQQDYYNQFKPLVDKPWTIFEDFRRMATQVSPAEQVNSREQLQQHFDEKISDNCLTQITGTNLHSKRSCQISLNCLKLMTSANLIGYGNTHQILYFLIGFHTGCRYIIEKEFRKFRGQFEGTLNVNQFLEKKCKQIFNEMNELKENVVVNGDTDLFMEQGLVCGILGYEEFLDVEILENIFLWQDKERGCFGEDSRIMVKSNH